ncbi:HAD-superfamily hydrolase, subfamily IA, probable phosphoglycolate phosphatase [Campylobacter iguaniorum]|uniref:HAD family hydrolase n=1 Tax=Campylobacter iguaniorum TaxID=1244531 RepID=UPI0007C8D53F|nr:HAD family hydrolase [Campylobacter iguaniorum]ANE35483.1 HAD-superfamily hydrolase, subfamily IA, probable phosphoglycolate phosphatase [Campylobacter iguaniorum]
MATILFDLDGTLIDSTSSILHGFHTAFDKFSFPNPTDEQICSLIGHPLDYMFANLGVRNELVWDFVAAYKEAYRQKYLDETKLLDGAFEAVAMASEFADLGVVTTKTSKYSVYLLEHLNIAKYFKTIIGKDDVTNPKPDPEPILKALKRLNKPAINAFMVGDTPMDANSAKAAGIVSIGVTCGYENSDTLKSCCDFVCLNAKEAVNHIKSRLNL